MAQLADDEGQTPGGNDTNAESTPDIVFVQQGGAMVSRFVDKSSGVIVAEIMNERALQQDDEKKTTTAEGEKDFELVTGATKFNIPDFDIVFPIGDKPFLYSKNMIDNEKIFAGIFMDSLVIFECNKHFCTSLAYKYGASNVIINKKIILDFLSPYKMECIWDALCGNMMVDDKKYQEIENREQGVMFLAPLFQKLKQRITMSLTIANTKNQLMLNDMNSRYNEMYKTAENAKLKDIKGLKDVKFTESGIKHIPLESDEEERPIEPEPEKEKSNNQNDKP